MISHWFHSKHQDASATRHTTSACAGLSANHPLIAFLEINNVGKVAVGISFRATSSDVLFCSFLVGKVVKIRRCMFTKIALKRRLSRKTVGFVHRYLFDFGQGAHRVFWVGQRAYIETDCPADVTLLRDQFPTMIDGEVDQGSHDFPW